jgi:hypothetical protein
MQGTVLQISVRWWLGGAPPRLAWPRRRPVVEKMLRGFRIEVPGLPDFREKARDLTPRSHLILLQLSPSTLLLSPQVDACTFQTLM